MKTKGGRKRGSVLLARQEDFDENMSSWEKWTGLHGGYKRPGSQQKEKRR